MKKTRVSVNLRAACGLTLPFEIEGCEAVPGILVHRQIIRASEGIPVQYAAKACQVTHISSGASFGTTYYTLYSDLVKRVKAGMTGLDWSIGTAEILASPAHSNAARIAVHGE